MKYLVKTVLTNRETKEQRAYYNGKGGRTFDVEDFNYVCCKYGYNRLCDAKKGLKSAEALREWEINFNREQWNREPIWSTELQIEEFAEYETNRYMNMGKAC